ncbi:uncharacterized protein BDV17DRAFT_294464 [Aspergillus undulatus]|uniref:uncharacterized protein n=1 Tax=Aspergillus undulatus TaxID=1810928 RepID=UPI003CCD3424
MDPIEPAGPSPDHFPHPQPQPRRASAANPYAQESTSSNPPPARPRAASVNSNRSSIRLYRPPSIIQNNQSTTNLPSRNNASRASFAFPTIPPPEHSSQSDAFEGGRRRSSSEPRPGRWSAPSPAALPRLQPGEPMHTVMEEQQSPGSGRRPTSEFARPAPVPTQPPPQAMPRRNLLRRTSEAAINRLSRNRASTVSGSSPTARPQPREYDSHVVDVLDVIDPEVSALTTLTNVQNSLFVPYLGPLVNRNQTYVLSPPPEMDKDESTSTDEDDDKNGMKGLEPRPALERPITSISSVLHDGEPRFAILPDGINLEGWTYEDIEELNDHVRHMLHSRRSKFKRSMKGFGKYVRKPLGFLITLYATLITLFGLAWVLFLIGWINVGGRQSYIINVIDNVLVALFAIMGDGLAPFRAVDTYHMIFIAHYTFLTWKIRRKRNLPKLKDKNDLPERREGETSIDIEAGALSKEDEHEFSVLNRVQQLKLQHHQAKFAKSHTFYKPHETITHHAFPQRFLIAIVVILDCHSLLQIALGATTWGISYHVRPFALTTVILCCSIACNITGGVLIMIGDRKTRKKDVVERMFRQQLTKEAMKKMQKKRKKEQEKFESEHPGVLSDDSTHALQVTESDKTNQTNQNPKVYEGS